MLCCPKSFDSRSWAVACAYTTLLLYGTAFLIFIPFVFHPEVFDCVTNESSSQLDLQTVLYHAIPVYGATCSLCIGSFLVALLSLLCIVGIHKESSALLTPYLILMSTFAYLSVVKPYFAFNNLRFLDELSSMTENSDNIWAYTEMNEVITSIKVLLTLLSYWIFITPIAVVGRHCNRLMTRNASGYVRVPFIEGPAPTQKSQPCRFAAESTDWV